MTIIFRKTVSFGVYKLLRNAHATFIHAKREQDFDIIYDEIFLILNQYKEYFPIINQSLKEAMIHKLMMSCRLLYHFMILYKRMTIINGLIVLIDFELYLIIW